MANTAIRGVPVHFGIDVDSWRWLRSQNAWRAPWPAYIVVPFRVQQHARNSVDFLCFTMARGHFAAFSCPTGCAATIRFSWFLQWPALILWHFHVQSYERNSLDFLRFTMARGHFAAFSCPTGCAATIRFSWFYNGPRSFCGIL